MMDKFIIWLLKLLGVTVVSYRVKGKRRFVKKGNRTSVNYREIWSDAYGDIPNDEYGKTFHIHHVDGNCHNNKLKNLEALSHRMHLQRHIDQGDWAAAALLKESLKGSKYKVVFEDTEPYRVNSRKKAVVQVDLKGNRIATFESTIEAEKMTGVRNQAVSMGARGSKSQGGFQWRYEEDIIGVENIGPVNRNPKSNSESTNSSPKSYLLASDKLKKFTTQGEALKYIGEKRGGWQWRKNKHLFIEVSNA